MSGNVVFDLFLWVFLALLAQQAISKAGASSVGGLLVLAASMWGAFSWGRVLEHGEALSQLQASEEAEE